MAIIPLESKDRLPKMKTKIKNPTQIRGRGVRVQKLKSFCNAPIIGDSRAKSQASPSKYKQIVDIFKYSGGHDEAEIYLSHWGVSPIIKDLLLASAKYDALSGGCDA